MRDFYINALCYLLEFPYSHYDKYTDEEVKLEFDHLKAKLAGGY